MSADREGPDAEIGELAEAMLGIRKYATGDYFGDRAYATAIERSERALLLPGVVAARFGKARPAVEDPRDALLAKCAAELDAAAVRHWGHTGVGLRDHEQDCSECRPLYALLAALRAAGVEPTPAAQEVKASR